jgi:hypothetical protein
VNSSCLPNLTSTTPAGFTFAVDSIFERPCLPISSAFLLEIQSRTKVSHDESCRLITFLSMETRSGRRHAMSSRTPTSRAEEALPHQTSPPAAAAPHDPAQVPAVATPKPKLVIKLTIDRNKPEYISQNDAITVAELKRQSAQEEVKSGTEEKHRANRALPLPQPKRFQGALPPLAPNTVCVSTLLKEEDLARMPSLDGATLTRAQRRASASLHARPKVVTNGVNGVHANTSRSSASQVNAATTNGEVELKKKPSSSNSSKKLEDKEREKALERNIDNVIFGDVTFKAWYPSWYPKEIIGEKALNGDGKGIVVGELYVCKRCFGYGKVVTEWVRHTRVCEREVPGRKIYDHGKDGAWSVWEVDGGVETVSLSFPHPFHTGICSLDRNTILINADILPKPFPLRKALPRQ